MKTRSSDWRNTKLGDVLTLQRGYDLPERDRREGTVPIVTSSGITGFHDTAKAEGPGVVTGRYGTLGEVYFIKEDFWPHNTTLFVRDFKGNDPLFIKYFLGTLGLGVHSAAAAVPGLNRNALHLLSVRIPSFPTQRKIAVILSAYDDLIENNTRRIKILEEMAQMLYREWFVNFRFPGHDQARMVKTKLGQVPEGWEVKKLGDVATFHRGRSYRTPDLAEDGGLPFLNLKCIERGGGFRHDGIKRYIGVYKPEHIAKTGDLIVAVTDMTQERRLVAHAARVHLLGESMGVMSMDLVRVEPKPDIPKDYLHGMLRFSSFGDEVSQHANGVNVLHLKPAQIEAFQFALPPSKLRNRYAEFCRDAYLQSNALHAKNVNLRRTRDLLLPKLISGAVEVDGMDIEGVADAASV